MDAPVPHDIPTPEPFFPGLNHLPISTCHETFPFFRSSIATPLPPFAPDSPPIALFPPQWIHGSCHVVLAGIVGQFLAYLDLFGDSRR